MSYSLGGANSESLTFEKTISNFALMTVHESTGLISLANVVNPNQGNTYVIPRMAPVTWASYDEAGSGGTYAFGGNAAVQNPAFEQASITAAPYVATTMYGKFISETSAFQLAASLGQEIGASFAEKVDQIIGASFKTFKLTAGNTNYATSADGFDRVKALGALELLLPAGTADVDSAVSVLALLRMVKGKWKQGRLPGNPVVVLDSSLIERLLGELTGGAVNQSGGSDLSMLGNELLSTGQITNIYGVQVVFSSFLSKNGTDIVGAYLDSSSLYAVVKQMMEIQTGVVDGGLANWITGTAYLGAGVADQRHGGAILIKTA